MNSNRRRSRGPWGGAAVAAPVVLCALLALTSCGKTITIEDSSDSGKDTKASSAPPPATASPQPANGNAALRVVDSSAADNGRTGDGGSVVGAAVQETPPQWVQLSAVQSPELGRHLININQATLYRFDRDTTNPPRSACVDACAVTWPPVTIEEGGNVYLAGVDERQVGAIRRPDGSVQITVGGHPLYRFSGDTRAGDANGQGLQGTWFAADQTGEKAAP
ncbi:hypothetical protein ACFYYH_18740 [Streptomyces sp. NPDC002018]|uniref:hypothetical protein n=1 Tax=Streptomyces sp. NPDC002018 TaxID=3364629 RepID=UPI0036C6945E